MVLNVCLRVVAPCRHREDGAVPTRQPVADGVHRAGGAAAVPGHGGRSSDHAALRPAGGDRTSEWTLLLLLRRTGSVRRSPRRRGGPETVGGQREVLWTLLRRSDQRGL